MTLLSIRTLIAPGALAVLALAAGAAAMSPGGEAVILGEGDNLYSWDGCWGKLADGSDLGNTHGCIVVDASSRVYVNTDTEQAVMVFDPEGELLGVWGAELRGGLHGMTLVREGDREFLTLAHTTRHEILAATLDGEILWRLGYPEESGIYASADQYRPTAVAVAPDGRIFAADGYGKSFVHRYDADRNYLGSFGGPGSEPGKLRTPHGLMIDNRSGEPRLLVADRENNRLQYFDLEGRHLGVVSGMLRRPCNIAEHDGQLAVADLAGRVTLLGADNELIVHLGDNPDPALRAQNRIARDHWHEGEFLSPHGLSFDHDGNLYVQDWNFLGRITKLRRLQPLHNTVLDTGGVVIDHSPAATERYIGSPSIAALEDPGILIVSHDLFGAGSTKRVTRVLASTDGGTTWEHRSDVDEQYSSSAFVHDGSLYLMGTSEAFGYVVIRRSTDGGRSWTTPADSHSGLILASSQFHTAAVPVIEHAGQIWRSMEESVGTGGWPQTFRSFALSAPVGADLLDAASWTRSATLASDPAWFGESSPGGWLDGNITVSPTGEVVNVLRVAAAGQPDLAAIVGVSPDGAHATFDPERDLVRLPGGGNGFTIRLDERTGLYWAIVNAGGDTSRLMLVNSTDLHTWTARARVVTSGSPTRHGFQHAGWIFAGDDILAVVQTAYDDPLGGAPDPHRANYLTFHRVRIR